MPQPTLYGPVILWERPVQFWAEKILKQGDDVLDIGVNVGGVAIAFSRLVGPQGRVLGVEANPALIPAIKSDIAANHADNITLIEAAAYRQSGLELNFAVDPSYYASASSLYFEDGTDRQTITVKTVTIDELCAAHNFKPRLIKIDIEGAELDALKGAVQTLENCKPYIIFESMNQNPELFGFLRERGYGFFDTNTLDLPYDDRDIYLRNIVAVPPGGDLKPVVETAKAVTHNKATNFIRSVKEGLKCLIKGNLRGEAYLHIEFRVPEAGDYLVEVSCSYNQPGEAQFHLYEDDKLVHMGAAEVSQLANSSCCVFPETLGKGELRLTLRYNRGEGRFYTIDRVRLAPLKIQ